MARKSQKKSKRPVAKVVQLARKATSISDPVSMDKLMDFLSEFLAVEKGGTRLYRAAAGRSTDPEIRDTYLKYLRQTERHAELLTDAISRIGGDPKFISKGASVQMKRAKSMLELEVPPELRELADAENILLAETKDHKDWEFLDAIGSKIPDDDARDVISEIVDEVEDEEDEHLEFAKKAVDKLANLAVRRGQQTRKRAA